MNNFNWAADLVNQEQTPSTSGTTSINKNNDEALTAIVNSFVNNEENTCSTHTSNSSSREGHL